jgi:hypothetical protein
VNPIECRIPRGVVEGAPVPGMSEAGFGSRVVCVM